MELTGNTAFAQPNAQEAVLSEWYDTYGTDVLRLCCFYLGSRADAEDAVQETYLKAWRHMDRFQGRKPYSVKAWLLKIACNACRDQFRRAWRKREVAQDNWAGFEQIPREDRDLMLDVMQLPGTYRAVILLVYLQRLTLRETADILRVSPATVSRWLCKAKEMLKRAEIDGKEGR